MKKNSKKKDAFLQAMSYIIPLFGLWQHWYTFVIVILLINSILCTIVFLMLLVAGEE